MNSFAPVIFRVASWPIDAIRSLCSPEYAAEWMPRSLYKNRLEQ